MSGSVPVGPIATKDGNASEPMRALLQTLTESTGGAYEVRLERVGDTAIRIRMKGADGVWRASASIPLS